MRRFSISNSLIENAIRFVISLYHRIATRKQPIRLKHATKEDACTSKRVRPKRIQKVERKFTKFVIQMDVHPIHSNEFVGKKTIRITRRRVRLNLTDFERKLPVYSQFKVSKSFKEIRREFSIKGALFILLSWMSGIVWFSPYYRVRKPSSPFLKSAKEIASNERSSCRSLCWTMNISVFGEILRWRFLGNY